MTLPDNDTLAKLLADAEQHENWMLADRAEKELESLSHTLAAEVIALRKRVEAADRIADVLDAAIKEHDTADYGYGEENPWTMKEWFEDEERAALTAYRATTPTNPEPKE